MRLRSLALLAVLGCGSDGGDLGRDGGGDGPAMDGSAAGACGVTFGGSTDPQFDQTGSVFTFTGAVNYVEIRGVVLDGPALSLHVEADRAGACRLLTYESSFCDPVCAPDQICVDAACLAQPATRSAGSIEVSGVGEDVTLEAMAGDQYYWGSKQVAVDDVDEVALAAEGDETPPFSLRTCVRDAVDPVGDWAAAMASRAPGQDVVLSWSDPIDTARVYLRMTTGIGTHGGISPVEIECESPDIGSLTLPGAFLDALYDPAYWSCGECGDNRLLRYHATETAAGGSVVQLRSQASSSFWFIP